MHQKLVGGQLGPTLALIKSVSFGAIFGASINNSSVSTKHTAPEFCNLGSSAFLADPASVPARLCPPAWAIFLGLVQISPSWTVLFLKCTYHFYTILYMPALHPLENWWCHFSCCQLFFLKWLLSPKWIPSSAWIRMISYKFLRSLHHLAQF